MEQYGRTLAATHKITTRRTRDPLLARLADNENKLIEVCNLLTESLSIYQRVTPAGEWLIDNFHLIEEQIATAKRHLPRVTAESFRVWPADHPPGCHASTTLHWKPSRTAMGWWTRTA